MKGREEEERELRMEGRGEEERGICGQYRCLDETRAVALAQPLCAREWDRGHQHTHARGTLKTWRYTFQN